MGLGALTPRGVGLKVCEVALYLELFGEAVSLLGRKGQLLKLDGRKLELLLLWFVGDEVVEINTVNADGESELDHFTQKGVVFVGEHTVEDELGSLELELSFGNGDLTCGGYGF